jgi:quercetin dioxygenase-like cupin family protein
MGSIYDPGERTWREIERAGAKAVEGLELLPLEDGGRTRLALTRIAAGGTFGPHIDEYAHVFCIVGGHGEVMVGKQRQSVGPGMVITIDIREPHGLWAGDDEPLVLLSANVYPEYR